MSEYGNHLDVDGNVRAWQARAPGDCVVLGDDMRIPEELLPEGFVATVPVESISISGTLSGETGGTLTLVAEVSPENATNRAVTWAVTDGSEHVSIQSQTGSTCTISLVSAGSAVITATAQDGSGISQTATVTVTDPVVLVTAISISGDNTGDVGETVTLTAAVTPSNATNRAVTWAVTSGTSYAEIASQTDDSCVVRLTGAGSAVITATAQDGSGVTATHTIAISEPFVEVTAIAISGDTSGDIGTYITLTATVTPSNATNPAVTWSVSAGTGYIAITQQTADSCTVYCQAEGTGTVTATAQDGSGVTATHTIQSVDPTVYVTAIEITGDASGTVGGTISLTATVTPANATNPAVTWAVTSGTSYARIASQTGTSCTVSLVSEGTATITATATDGSGVRATHTITVTAPSTAIPADATLSVSFDATVFATDPGSCLTYTGDLAGCSPVRNTATSLATATDEGSWGFDRSTGIGPLGMFYATFQSGSSGQYLHELLDPYDLTRYIATWDDSSKSWDYGNTGSSHITTENTMLCIPTVYMSGTATSLSLSPRSGSGSAYAHTIDGHTYEYLAIGVYLGYVDSDMLRSVSDATATGNLTRAEFRTYAQANSVRDGWAGQWNYHQWSLVKYLAWISARHFNLQAVSGQGGLVYSASTTGLCDALGPYAGDVSGTASAQKHLIENFWGSMYQWIDDAYCEGALMYVGQNSSPTDDAEDKVAVTCAQVGGFPGEIATAMPGWGMGSAGGGSSTTGLCDYQSSSSNPAPLVGGFSGSVSSGNAGPGYLGRSAASYSGSTAYRGARLAFAFDLRAPSPARANSELEA